MTIAPSALAVVHSVSAEPLSPQLQSVLQHPGVWRHSSSASHHVRAQSTGFAELDDTLPGNGWPLGALTEILFDFDGVGEMALVMPALAQLTQRRQRIVFVAPPHIPYAPALAAHGIDLRYAIQIDATATQGAWSAEQCLRSGACGAVLSWHGNADYTQLRRLQLAAESGDALSFLFRPAHAAAKPSPAALRLRLHTEETMESQSTESWLSESQFTIEVLKCRGNLDRQRSTRLRCRV